MVDHPRESRVNDLQFHILNWYGQGCCSDLYVASSRDSSHQCAREEQILTIELWGMDLLVPYHRQEHMSSRCGRDRGSLVQEFS